MYTLSLFEMNGKTNIIKGLEADQNITETLPTSLILYLIWYIKIKKL